MNDWDDIPTQIQDLPKQADTRVWSEEQLAIKKWAGESRGNARVIARAGTGKTTAIQHMIIPAAPESKILYVCFNKKNKVEAEKKISDGRVDIKTFNGLGYSFCRYHWKGVKPDDTVEGDRIRAAAVNVPVSVAHEIGKLVAWAKNTAPFASAAELSWLAECQGFEAEPEDAEAGWDNKRFGEVAYEAMQAAKVQDPQNRLSFNDQVWLPVVMNWVRPWWDLVVGDEQQDCNETQYLLLSKSFRRGGRIAGVGDPRQCIYTWRGAMHDGMDRLSKQFKAEDLKLTTTYRCAQRIVKEAQQYVPDIRWAPGAPEGVVRELPSTVALLKEVKVGDAILSRANSPLMPICLALLKKGIPSRIEGRDIGRTLNSIASSFKAKSVPEFIRKVSMWAKKKIDRVLAKELPEEVRQGQVEGIRDTEDVFYAVAEDAVSVNEILQRITSLFQDSEDNQRPAVVLSSVHRAKGLEWDKVFLLESTFRPERGGEEENIVYVAITRAKNELVWVL